MENISMEALKSIVLKGKKDFLIGFMKFDE